MSESYQRYTDLLPAHLAASQATEELAIDDFDFDFDDDFAEEFDDEWDSIIEPSSPNYFTPTGDE